MPRTDAESAGLERKVTFFGCDEDGATAIVYLPNRIGTTVHYKLNFGVIDSVTSPSLNRRLS